VVYPNRRTEKAAGIEFEPFMSLPQLRRVYLEDYQDQPGLTPTLELIRLIASQERQAIALARELAGRRDELGMECLDFIETILIYKLPQLSRQEIKKMLALNDIELKQTRFYQEIAEEERQEGMREGRQEECIALLARLLRRKFGVQPQLEAMLPHLSGLPLERLEDLADALLDFTKVDELQEWLQNR
jgi:predicted transposase YdaD